MPRKQIGNTFAQQNTLPTLVTVGEIHPGRRAPGGGPHMYYKHPNGQLWEGDSLRWLRTIPENTIDLIFADPPYNIGKAQWDEFKDMREYVNWSATWIEAASRALKPTGSLYICGFSEILADLKSPASKYFAGCKWLVWSYKNKANLGKDWGRSHESIIHLRKSSSFRLNIDNVRIPYGKHTLRYPVHPQSESSQYGRNGDAGSHKGWTPNSAGAKPKDVIEVPVTSNGMREKTPHPTQKPEELMRKLILAASNPGDLVADPFAGSGSTLVVAEQLGRKWAGCEKTREYNEWTVIRIENVAHRAVDAWIKLDEEAARRRESIR